MTVLWTEQSAASAAHGKAEGKWQAQRVEIDSRKVQPGDLFVAIKGERVDGHAYVADALRKGAVAAVVSTSSDTEEGKFLMVRDTITALEDLGKHLRAQTQARVVGVTGSVGKTSAKEMLRMAFTAHGKTYATNGNYNNHIGTPLNLANLPPDTDFAVFEMGMNHAGEIAHLTWMVRPDVAVITTVEAVHAEFFDSADDIAKAKAEIFDGLQPDGAAVLNRDNAYFNLLKEVALEKGVARIITFGEHADSDCRLLYYATNGVSSEVHAVIHGTEYHYTLQTVGRHWALLSLMVLAVTRALSLDVSVSIHALAEFREVEGRGRVCSLSIPGGEVLLVDDSYNASPAAMRAAFAKLEELHSGRGKKGRTLALLGDMLELGKESDALHKALAESIVLHRIDKVYVAGTLMKHLYDALPAEIRGAYVGKALDLLPILQKDWQSGDIILVKGSHGSHMYQLAHSLKESDVHSLPLPEVKHAL